jgi:hypothetical protein
MTSIGRIITMSGVALLALGHGAPARAGSIAGTLTQQQVSNANLTALGTTDWAVWGEGSSTSLAPTDSMSGGSGIGNLTDITNGDPLRGLGQYGNYGESTLAWTNGTPTSSASGVFSGIQNNATSCCEVGEGFSFSIAAGTGPQQLTIFDGVNYAVATLTATLSDSSAPTFTQTIDNDAFNQSYYSVLDFSADSAGQTLNVSLTVTTNYALDGTGNVNIQAMALSPTTPEPGTTGLCMAGICLAGLAAIVRKRRAEPRVL